MDIISVFSKGSIHFCCLHKIRTKYDERSRPFSLLLQKTDIWNRRSLSGEEWNVFNTGLHLLTHLHHIISSVKTLLKEFARNSLFRGTNYTDLEEIAPFWRLSWDLPFFFYFRIKSVKFTTFFLIQSQVCSLGNL